MATELICARRARQIVEENDDQLLLRRENKKKKQQNGVPTALVHKKDKKGLNEPQTTIFRLLTDKIGCKF